MTGDTIEIEGLHLYTTGKGVAVDIQIRGVWRRAITEDLEIVESCCSHIIEPSGMQAAPVSPLAR